MTIYDLKNVHLIEHGEGKTVLFLHGWGQSLESMMSLIRLLSVSYHCVAIDLPGFGNSKEPDEDWGVNDYCQLIQRLKEFFGWNLEAIVGHSFGGKIAFHYALHYRLKHLVLIAPSTVKPKIRMKTLLRRYSYRICRRLCPFIQLSVLKRIFASRDYSQSSRRMQQILIKATHTYYDRDLQYLVAPTLVMWGKKDSETPFNQLKIHEHRIPLVEKYISPLGTHFGHQENPRQYAYRIHQFLRKWVDGE